VNVGIAGDYLIVLKEKWKNWKFIENQADLKKYRH
jgi:hypothetical protein